MNTIHFPGQNEYLPDYHKYVMLVRKGDIIETLQRQHADTQRLIGDLSEAQGNYRYAPDKWSIKEVVGHMIDCERIFAYRSLRFSRNDKAELPGFDQDPYIQFGNFNNCKLSELAREFEHVRQSTILLFRHLNDEAWTRRGTANGAEITVRALAYIIAGHELHHVGILRSKYLGG